MPGPCENRFSKASVSWSATFSWFSPLAGSEPFIQADTVCRDTFNASAICCCLPRTVLFAQFLNNFFVLFRRFYGAIGSPVDLIFGPDRTRNAAKPHTHNFAYRF